MIGTQPHASRRAFRHRMVVAVLLAAASLFSTVARVDARDSYGPASSESSGDPKPPASESEKQRAAAIGIGALAGIVLIGIGLVAATVVLGRRAHRIAREPLPARTPDDPFGHLRPAREPVADSLVSDDERDSDSDPIDRETDT